MNEVYIVHVIVICGRSCIVGVFDNIEKAIERCKEKFYIKYGNIKIK